jgi:5'(3')-deoxyribonucleotidase
MGLDVFVDDHVMNLYYMPEQGVKPLLMDQPWNRRNPDFHRVYGMADVKKYIGENLEDRL